MYTLEMCIANIRHKSWWWNGAPFYKFDTLDNLIDFMLIHIPGTILFVDSIRKNDLIKEHGRLAITSWYLIRKGEEQMTEYTSF